MGDKFSDNPSNILCLFLGMLGSSIVFESLIFVKPIGASPALAFGFTGLLVRYFDKHGY